MKDSYNIIALSMAFVIYAGKAIFSSKDPISAEQAIEAGRQFADAAEAERMLPEEM